MNEIVITLISLCGTAIGTFGGIYASAKLTSYRLSQLELKVDRHSRFAERIPILEERISAVKARVDELEYQ